MVKLLTYMLKFLRYLRKTTTFWEILHFTAVLGYRLGLGSFQSGLFNGKFYDKLFGFEIFFIGL